jgi:glucan biosynthesis protein C
MARSCLALTDDGSCSDVKLRPLVPGHRRQSHLRIFSSRQAGVRPLPVDVVERSMMDRVIEARSYQMNPANPNAVFTRRHDLDWLRIIAFGLLIFYHIGMFYVTWGWHVKSPYASEAAEPLMQLLNPWRLALLFFISGVAIRFLSDKIGSLKFALDRSWRLFPVILFGMYFVVAPQSYFELRTDGVIEAGFGDFYRQYAGEFGGPWSIHTPTWNHLWYVVYLFVYCLVLAPLIPAMRWLAESRLGGAFARLWTGPTAVLALVFVPIIPFWIYRATIDPMFPTTHGLFDDWANHAHRMTILLMGYFAAKSPRFWSAVRTGLPWVLGLTVILGVSLSYVWANWEMMSETALLWPARLARVLFAWTMILSLLGLSQRFLKGDGPIRRYLTEAIFPWYILHQTITVSAGYALGQLTLGVWTEFALLTIATIGGCALGFEIIRRIPPFRPVMGLKF